jgi:hypothetical protein
VRASCWPSSNSSIATFSYVHTLDGSDSDVARESVRGVGTIVVAAAVVVVGGGSVFSESSLLVRRMRLEAWWSATVTVGLVTCPTERLRRGCVGLGVVLGEVGVLGPWGVVILVWFPVGHGRKGGMFSPNVRVSFSIFLRRSGAAFGGSVFANVGLSWEEMMLGLEVQGMVVLGDMDWVVERESVDEETEWRWSTR